MVIKFFFNLHDFAQAYLKKYNFKNIKDNKYIFVIIVIACIVNI